MSEVIDQSRATLVEAEWLVDELKKPERVLTGSGVARLRKLALGSENRIALPLTTALRMVIAHQFGGFVGHSDPTPDAIQNASDNEAFFSSDKNEDDDVGRIWFLVAYREAFKLCNNREAETKAWKAIIDLVMRLGLQGAPPPDELPGLDGLRRLAARQLLCKFEIVNDGRQPEYERAMRNFLSVHVAEQKAPALEVSLLLRAYKGRYVNNGPSAPPDFEPVLLQAIDYILSTSSPTQGTWNPSLPDGTSPLLHEVSPLLHVLDLPLTVLRARAVRLTNCAELALRSVADKLSQVRHKLRTNETLDDRDVRRVAIGLSVGHSCYDRFRELLSDDILSKSHAITVPSARRKDLPKALHFGRVIEAGLVKKWRSFASDRPGAILVFGPPGTGKTTVAKTVAGRLNQKVDSEEDRWRLLILTPADFARNGTDAIVATAEDLFWRLKRIRRCVVLLDEMEEFLRDRALGEDRENRLITTAFLPLLQETVTAPEVILFIATNLVSSIDPAVTRPGRTDLVLPLGWPDKKSVVAKLKERSRPQGPVQKALKKKSWKKVLVTTLSGYTFGEIASLATSIDAEPDLYHADHVSFDQFRRNLWLLRSQNVPLATSGRTGCDSRRFKDECKLFSRPPVEPQLIDNYFEEPWFPDDRSSSPATTIGAS